MLLKIILFALIFKSSVSQSFFMYSFFVFSIFYSIWTSPFYDSLIYFKDVFCSNSCFKIDEVMYRAMQCSELRSHIKRVRDLLFVFYLQIRALVGNTDWTRNWVSVEHLVLYSNFSFILSPPRACICKQTTHINL